MGAGNECAYKDADCWLECVKGSRQYGDICNAFVGVFDWSPFAARPYTVVILSPETGNTLTASVYQEAIDALKEIFPELKKIPKSVWLVQ